jgi:FtsZ-binding cell division protein ZapB
MSIEVENNLKNLEEKINQAINFIDSLRQENVNLKTQLTEMQNRNSQIVEKINFILDNISKLL